MSRASEPENLLADALRAQAARTPVPPAGPAGGTGSSPELGLVADASFQLLSGSDYAGTAGLAGETSNAAGAATTAPTPGPAARRPRPEPLAAVPAVWVLLLAVLLGLGAGAIAGVLTLL